MTTDYRLTNLAEQIVAGNCVLFLGPDISESDAGHRGLPTSWQLADELAEQCGYRGQYQPLPRMAQIFAHQLGEGALIRFLQERLTDPQYKPLPIHEIVAQLPFPYIIHAGWDNLLEAALERRQVKYTIIQNAQQLAFARNGATVIYKPYGALNQPESLIITEQRQNELLQEAQIVLGELRHLLARYHLLLVGYALDYDAVFSKLFYETRRQQGELRPPALVVQSLQRPDDAVFWGSLGVTVLTESPTLFLYNLAQAVAAVQQQEIDLPDIKAISATHAPTYTDLEEHITLMNRVLDTLGIAELIEQSDVPLLNREQIRHLQAMQAAYTRLAEGMVATPASASMWLRLGNIEYVRQNYALAQAYYERALATGDTIDEAYHNLHYLFLAQHAVTPTTQRQQAQAWLARAFTAYHQAVTLNPTLAILPAQYVVEQILGQGGVGVVYRTQDTIRGSVVAVKVLKRAFMYNEKAIARFQREAAFLQQIVDPHIVQMIEFAQFAGHSFIVMEYLGDQTVEWLLRERQRLSLDEAHALIQQCGAALHTIHQQGIIHRDLKPSNIFIINDRVKLIDFGLAADLTVGELSLTGTMSGTIRYMAPEQRLGQAVDARTDLYALATLFYTMLTGRQPDEGAYAPVSELVDGIDPALDMVIDKARQPLPADRYQDVATFCAELAQVVPLQLASLHTKHGWLRQSRAWLTAATQDYWLLTLVASFLVGYGLAQSLPAVFTLPMRFLGLATTNLLWVALLLRLYIGAYVRQRGYGTLSIYSPLWAALLAFGITLALWSAEAARGEEHSLLPKLQLGWRNYAIYVLIFGIMSILLTLLSLGLTTVGIQFTLRLHQKPARGFVLSAGLTLAVLFLVYFLLRKLNGL